MLPDLQAAFRAGTVGGDASAVEALNADGMENAHRFGVYRNNIFLSLTGVLEAAYPTIHRLVGDENFAALANHFIAAHPPKEPQLYTYGAAFAAFLEGFEPAVSELPFLPDLARVEWAVNEAYFEADAPVLTPEGIATLDPEKYGLLLLNLHPTTRLIASDWPVWDLWGAEAMPDPWPEEAQSVLVHRPGSKVDVIMVSPGDIAFVEALAAGAPLGAAAAAGAEAEEGFDLAAALGGHLGRGTFRADFTIVAEPA